MKLSQDSLTATLYKWFYNTELPENFCPYFWRVMFMYIMILPITILGLVPILIGDNPWSKRGDRESNLNRVVFGLSIYFAIFLIFSAVSFFFTITKTYHEGSFWGVIREVGTSVWSVIIVFGLYGLSSFIYHKIKERKRNKRNSKMTIDEFISYEPKKYLLIEFVKAKYKRYCPKIEWTPNKKS